MDFKTAVFHYYPYWLLGIGMIVATLRSEYKDLMRFQLTSFLKFARIMIIVTIFRVISMHFAPPTLQSVAPILQIPLWLTLTTPWEDACHTLILAIAARFLGSSIPSRIILFGLMVMVQLSFFTGHVYEGLFSAILISFYIPVVTNLGKKYGFATVMAGHVLYDFLTLLTVRLFLGL